jgi:thiosulfate reductase cytochrome b subunit
MLSVKKMEVETNNMELSKPERTQPKQAVFAKIFHWLNLIAVALMLTSGLQIYNANPVFGGRGGWHFPDILLLGGWLGGGRHFHFAAMWLFGLNLCAYGIYIFATKRWQHRFFGNGDRRALLLSSNPKRKNYALHRLAYTLIIPVLLLSLLTGLGMYKPVQFHWIVDLWGGSWYGLRVAHFIAVPTLILYTVFHSLQGIKVGGRPLLNSIFW